MLNLNKIFEQFKMDELFEDVKTKDARVIKDQIEEDMIYLFIKDIDNTIKSSLYSDLTEIAKLYMFCNHLAYINHLTGGIDTESRGILSVEEIKNRIIKNIFIIFGKECNLYDDTGYKLSSMNQAYVFDAVFITWIINKIPKMFTFRKNNIAYNETDNCFLK